MAPQLAVNTDYDVGYGSPLPSIRQVAEAGFTSIIWGHQWDTDFLYSPSEVAAIAACLEQQRVTLVDLHGTSGVEKCWYSPVEYERLAGVELVRNRIEMTARLGGDAVVLHPMVCEPDALAELRAQGLKSLQELEAVARNRGVLLALENLFGSERTKHPDGGRQCFDTIEYFFECFPPDYLGFCWDTGHCLILGDDALERGAALARGRLRALHLNDNRGRDDLHSPPLTWSDCWEFVAATIAESPYPADKPLAFEVNANPNDVEPEAFLNEVYRKALVFDELVQRRRAGALEG